jgi:hypothetical protein
MMETRDLDIMYGTPCVHISHTRTNEISQNRHAHMLEYVRTVMCTYMLLRTGVCGGREGTLCEGEINANARTHTHTHTHTHTLMAFFDPFRGYVRQCPSYVPQVQTDGERNMAKLHTYLSTIRWVVSFRRSL